MKGTGVEDVPRNVGHAIRGLGCGFEGREGRSLIEMGGCIAF
jgi:hypothetical protein